LLERAADTGGAHLLIFRGRTKDEDAKIQSKILPFFRVRWLDNTLLKFIPHDTNQFFHAINAVLAEEWEWSERIKPKDESSCLLLPECAFSVNSEVKHLWTVASERGLDRVNLAARVQERFSLLHWMLTEKKGARVGAEKKTVRVGAWIDREDRVFDHRGARHGQAPFPRQWRFSYRVEAGFHFDVTSRYLRPFVVRSEDGHRHDRAGNAHVNIDPHGYVRG
jgi:hypothetical protein